MTTSNVSTTESPADRYRRLGALFSQRVAAVPADRWDSPSPCAEWTAREVLRHVVEGETTFPAKVDVDIPAGPSVDDDPVAAWDYTRDAVQQVLDDPDKANREYDGGMGKTTLAASMGSFFCIDLVVHGWDIAHATGTDDAIPAEDVAFVDEFAKKMGDMIRSASAFGPALDVPADADEQTKLLAFLGRQA